MPKDAATYYFGSSSNLPEWITFSHWPTNAVVGKLRDRNAWCTGQLQAPHCVAVPESLDDLQQRLIMKIEVQVQDMDAGSTLS